MVVRVILLFLCFPLGSCTSVQAFDLGVLVSVLWFAWVSLTALFRFDNWSAVLVAGRGTFKVSKWEEVRSLRVCSFFFFCPQRVFCISYTQTQGGSLKILLWRDSCYSINRELPQCKLLLNKQNNDMGILFIKGLVLRQINSEGMAPAWVSAPSLILIVINEMEHIFSNSA